MKKIFVSLCLAAVAVGFSSCGSTKNAAVLADINGEWDIIEVNGAAVVPAPGQTFPYIGFNTSTGVVQGNAGCNRIVGSFDKSMESGDIDLSALATTRMMCPDMTVEQNVMNALAQVKHYVRLGEGNIGLCGNSLKRPVMVLKRKSSAQALSELAGKWKVVEVCGVAVPDTLENQPFVEINVKEKRVHAQAGCNLLNGAFQTEEGQSYSLSFPQLISTMMACPDMETEDRVKQALNTTRSFGKLQDGRMGFYDADRTLVLVLEPLS